MRWATAARTRSSVGLAGTLPTPPPSSVQRVCLLLPLLSLPLCVCVFVCVCVQSGWVSQVWGVLYSGAPRPGDAVGNSGTDTFKCGGRWEIHRHPLPLLHKEYVFLWLFPPVSVCVSLSSSVQPGLVPQVWGVLSCGVPLRCGGQRRLGQVQVRGWRELSQRTPPSSVKRVWRLAKSPLPPLSPFENTIRGRERNWGV